MNDLSGILDSFDLESLNQTQVLYKSKVKIFDDEIFKNFTVVFRFEDQVCKQLLNTIKPLIQIDPDQIYY